MNVILLSLIVFFNQIYAQAGYIHEKILSERDDSLLKKYPQIEVGSNPNAVVVNEDTYTIYVANGGDDTVSVIDGRNNTKIDDIPIGEPFAIGVNEETNKIYVDNNDTVSVINGTSNEIMDDIPVGEPFAIGVNEETNTIYFLNHFNDTVSVIDGTSNEIMDEIQVGKGPTDIGVNEETNKIYVAHHDNDTVSVINGRTDTKIDDIPVGKGPSGIDVNIYTNTIYVANYGVGDGSVIGGVSLIDGVSNKVLSKNIFNTEPSYGGHIECDKGKTIAPIKQEFYIYAFTECMAKPNQGFEFVSWQENLVDNSTLMLQVSPSPSILDSILDVFHLKPDKPEATLNITSFGSFTANFKELPPPIPGEYVATLFAVVISAFIGSWLTPAVIEWRKSKNQGKKLQYYHNNIKDLHKDGRIDQNDISQLDQLRNDITDDYTRGKINKDQYEKLEEEVSIKYREVFKNEIGFLDNLSKSDRENEVTKLRNSLEDAYATGKINELQYNLLEKLLGNEKSN